MVLAVRQGLTKKIFSFDAVHFKTGSCVITIVNGLTTVQTIVVCIHKNFTQNFNENANLCRH